jgi:hypothetical protein
MIEFTDISEIICQTVKILDPITVVRICVTMLQSIGL